MKVFISKFISIMGLLILLACENQPEESTEYLIEGYPIGKLTVQSDHPWIQHFIDIYDQYTSTALTAQNQLNSDLGTFTSKIKYLNTVLIDFLPFHKKSLFYSFYNLKGQLYEPSYLNWAQKLVSPQYKNDSNYKIQTVTKEAAEASSEQSTVTKTGTGFIVNRGDKSYVITNFHVACCASDPSSIVFELQSKKHPLLYLEIERVVALSASFDTAILELKKQILFKNSYRFIGNTETPNLLGVIQQGDNGIPIEIRGFPQGEEALVEGNLLYFPNETMAWRKDICISNITTLPKYEGISGSPLLIQPALYKDESTKREVIGLIWGHEKGSTPDPNQEPPQPPKPPKLRATSSQVVSEIFKQALERGTNCEISDCFKEEFFAMVQQLFNEGENSNFFTTRKLDIGCGSGDSNASICPESLKEQITNNLEKLKEQARQAGIREVFNCGN